VLALSVFGFAVYSAMTWVLLTEPRQTVRLEIAWAALIANGPLGLIALLDASPWRPQFIPKMESFSLPFALVDPTTAIAGSMFLGLFLPALAWRLTRQRADPVGELQPADTSWAYPSTTHSSVRRDHS
jgi:hypothetical protein